MDVELTFSEMRSKEVVNVVDGKRLGRIIDMVADARTGKVTGFITPGCKRFLFRASEDIFIPWCNIDKIGDDVILVRLGVAEAAQQAAAYPMPSQTPRCKVCPNCNGLGCARCRPALLPARDDCERLAAEWVYHKFRKNERRDCTSERGCGGSCGTNAQTQSEYIDAASATDMTIENNIAPNLTQNIRQNNSTGRKTGYYNRYDDRGNSNYNDTDNNY